VVQFSPTGKWFQIPSVARYMVLTTSPKILEEMMGEAENILSFNEALADVFPSPSPPTT